MPPICEGAAITREGIQPSCEASSHSSNSTIGLTSRSNTSGVRQLRTWFGRRSALLMENVSVIRLPYSKDTAASAVTD